MPPKRDVQTVDQDGTRLDELPEGMLLRPLVTHVDDRGTVCELSTTRVRSGSAGDLRPDEPRTLAEEDLSPDD